MPAGSRSNVSSRKADAMTPIFTVLGIGTGLMLLSLLLHAAALARRDLRRMGRLDSSGPPPRRVCACHSWRNIHDSR
jgi:hypothetical protein